MHIPESLVLLISSCCQPRKAVVKVSMLGDAGTGKTSLMVKYIEDKYDEDYIETFGGIFMEKTIILRSQNLRVTISVWDLGGSEGFATLVPLVCGDAKVILFAFDLTQKSSLFSVKRWYKEARKENKTFMPFLIGTKFDLFEARACRHHKTDITKNARRFARKMHAPLIYCSSAQSINVEKIFKLVIAKVFDLRPKIKEAHDATREALVEFEGYADKIKQDKKDKRRKDKKRKKRRDKKRKKRLQCVSDGTNHV